MLAKRIELAKQLDEKRKELELEKIVKELEAKAKYERENESVEIRKMQAKARMDTQRILDAIRMLSDQGKAIIDELLLHPERIALLVGMVLTLMLLYYTISEFIAIVRDFVKARLGRPTLVRETSVKWTLLPLPNFIRSLFAESMSSGLRRIEDVFKNVILSDDDKARVIQLALATRNTKMSGAPFRHVLLHGPPGTGKVLVQYTDSVYSIFSLILRFDGRFRNLDTMKVLYSCSVSS
jgi:ATPase family AAA domain-containing protein 3A/B